MKLMHAINRQSFEYTCNSETVERLVRHEIESSTASLIARMISTCLEEEVTGDDALRINRIEIDLGDILIEDFGKEEMLSRFGSLFRDQLRHAENSKWHS